MYVLIAQKEEEKEKTEMLFILAIKLDKMTLTRFIIVLKFVNLIMLIRSISVSLIFCPFSADQSAIISHQKAIRKKSKTNYMVFIF